MTKSKVFVSFDYDNDKVLKVIFWSLYTSILILYLTLFLWLSKSFPSDRMAIQIPGGSAQRGLARA